MGKISELEELLRLANKAADELNSITVTQQSIIEAMANELAVLRPHPQGLGMMASPEDIIDEYRKKLQKRKKRAPTCRKKR